MLQLILLTHWLFRNKFYSLDSSSDMHEDMVDYSLMTSWIVAAFQEAERDTSQYFAKGGNVNEIALDQILLKYLVEYEIPRKFGRFTARISSRYVGGINQEDRREIVDLWFNLEFRIRFPNGESETVNKLILFQSKKLNPWHSRISARSLEEFLSRMRLRQIHSFGLDSKFEELVIPSPQHDLLLKYSDLNMAYYLLHCPWDIPIRIERPLDDSVNFTREGSGGILVANPSVITVTRPKFRNIDRAIRLPEFIFKVLMCEERGCLYSGVKGNQFIPVQSNSRLTDKFPLLEEMYSHLADEAGELLFEYISSREEYGYVSTNVFIEVNFSES